MVMSAVSSVKTFGVLVTVMPRAGAAVTSVPIVYGDQLLPRLPNGGLVRWLGARGQLHRLLSQIGSGRHFLYDSHGPSIGQWLIAHGAGGRLVGGAVLLDDHDDTLGALRPGEVIEVRLTSAAQLSKVLGQLCSQLREQHLRGVSVGRLMHDAAAAA